MNNHEIDFLKNKTYIGVFYLPDDKEVMGQLIYQKNSNFELKLFSDFPLDKEKETAIPFIYGKIHDEQYETLLNPMSQIFELLVAQWFDLQCYSTNLRTYH